MRNRPNLVGTTLASAVSIATFFGGLNVLNRAESSQPVPASSTRPERAMEAVKASFVRAAPLHENNNDNNEADTISASEFLLSADDREIEQAEEDGGFALGSIDGFREDVATGFSGALSFGGKSKLTPRSTGASWYQQLSIDEVYGLVSRIIGEPASLQRKITHIESRGDPDAVNADSGARGLQQLIPQTYRRVATRYGNILMFGELGDKIRTVTLGHDSKGRSIIGYKAKPGYEAYVRESTHNPWINVSLAAMNRAETMMRIDNALSDKGYAAFKYVEADIYIGHFLGARPDIILAYRESPDAPARNFVNSRVRAQNSGMFYHPNGKARTVREMYAHIDDQGRGPSMSAPVSAYWRTPSTTIEQRLQVALAASSSPSSLQYR